MQKQTEVTSERDQHTIVLEKINSKIDLLVESHFGLSNKVDSLVGRIDNLETRFDHLETRFGNLELHFDHLELRFDHLENRFTTLEHKVDVGFATAFEYMERIEEELTGKLQTKLDKSEHKLLEKRVGKLEGCCVRDDK